MQKDGQHVEGVPDSHVQGSWADVSDKEEDNVKFNTVVDGESLGVQQVIQREKGSITPNISNEIEIPKIEIPRSGGNQMDLGTRVSPVFGNVEGTTSHVNLSKETGHVTINFDDVRVIDKALLEDTGDFTEVGKKGPGRGRGKKNVGTCKTRNPLAQSNCVVPGLPIIAGSSGPTI
ncbi:hypothetical protein NE237_002756 [Protea cynaroides]|uniref:Uncharacterized protein n=1 Tax=Protea cynaroides TaxID=273540 RepID=A0A9Q0QRX6_9MAGN|nr:hypothetical protein NE237_002756 [Protea cynaroides]